MGNSVGQVRERIIRNGKDEPQEEQECNHTYTSRRGSELDERILEGKDYERGEKS